MKTKHIIWIASLFIALVIALVITLFNQPSVAAQNTVTASMAMQITATATPVGVSEIGKTDGILIMGIVIVLIVITPLLFFKKK